MPKYTNNLISETSPYLLQHAHNPVNWYGWNLKTLELAKKENKLILISIGYSSCHWCHVMEHESFENEEVAQVMNQHFINIKVDREERPDVDQIYMSAVQLITGRGGWPLNCVALPDGRPVWGGTYFNKNNWINVLNQLADLFNNTPEKANEYAQQLTLGIANSNAIEFNNNQSYFYKSTLENSLQEWEPFMDFDLGGRRGAPKFPMPNTYQFLLRYGYQTKNKRILDYVNTSLTSMALGGINDQVEGGFARYAVDNKWHVPHFEKMLYDNAQLISLYSQAFKVSHNPYYKKTIYKTIDFIEANFSNSIGGYYSSLDADSLTPNGQLEEGAYYTFTKEELQLALKEDFNLFSAYYNINHYGYWEKNQYVLIRKNNLYKISIDFNIPIEEIEKKAKNWNTILLSIRNNKNKPRLDDKILTSWNALLLKGFVDASIALNDTGLLENATKIATFINTKFIKENGNLHHSFKNNVSTINGHLIDYATVIEGYIMLYEANFNETWLHLAKQLTDYTFDHFFDVETKMFFFTSDLDVDLILRKVEVEDNVISSSNSIMAKNLHKLGCLFLNNYYLKVSKQMLLNMIPKAEKHGAAYSNWLHLLCDYVGDFYEIAITGENTLQKLKKLNETYIPNKVFSGSIKPSNLPILQGRFSQNNTKIYACVAGTCNLPESDVDSVIDKLNFYF